MRIQGIRRERLKVLLKRHFGGSQRALADAVERNPNYISRVLSGKINLGEKLAREFETKIGLSPMWLDEAEPSEGPLLQGRVPLISWVRAGEPEAVVDNFEPGDGEDWIETTAPIKRHTYALRIEGDSMLPDFPPGFIIVIEPDLPAEPGHFVIAKNEADEVTFKQLYADAGELFLRPLNDRYPLRPAAGWQIIGVAIDVHKRLI